MPMAEDNYNSNNRNGNSNSTGNNSNGNNGSSYGSNSQTRDSSSKLIFENPVLCAQFLRGYLDIPLLKEVQPEDIEDVSERYVHMFTEERNSDVVKRVNIKTDGTPFFLVSLIEHKAKVDYNVVMQVFRYMAFIWEDYENEQERQHAGVSRTKEFKYPPILPVVFYDGTEDWTAAVSLHERILLSDIFKEYIPDYQCILMQLKDYSTAELMERGDELSIIMMVSKFHRAADFAGIGKEVDSGYLQAVTADTPEYLLDIMSQVIEALLLKINVPYKEAADFAGQVKERRMGELFSNFEAYDVQATRREAREEGIEEGIERTNKLTLFLIEQNRTDDLKRAAKDPAYQKQLFYEFGL